MITGELKRWRSLEGTKGLAAGFEFLQIRPVQKAKRLGHSQKRGMFLPVPQIVADSVRPVSVGVELVRSTGVGTDQLLSSHDCQHGTGKCST